MESQITEIAQGAEITAANTRQPVRRGRAGARRPQRQRGTRPLRLGEAASQLENQAEVSASASPRSAWTSPPVGLRPRPGGRAAIAAR
ncbi:hypothetical protein ACPA9J_28130 [Pseudomonas aeruginosa]